MYQRNSQITAAHQYKLALVGHACNVNILSGLLHISNV